MSDDGNVIKGAFDSAEPDKPSLREVVAVLAKKDLFEYLEIKKAKANELGMSAADLDRAVKDVRAKEGGTKGQGRPLDITRPDPHPEPVDGEPLANEIKDMISRYVILPEHGALVATLWALHTYVFGAWNISPKLFATSPVKGCGKTTFLYDVLGNLVCKPFKSSASLTGPLVVRVIELHQPCLLIDEADTFMKGDEVLRGVLNSSHKRSGAYVPKLVSVGDDYEPREFSTWAPMAIGGIGRIPDTLEDRSIVITMRRRMITEPLQDFDDDAQRAFEILASKAERWAEGMETSLSCHKPDMPKGVINRLATNWSPLLTVADAIGGDWPDAVREALKRSVDAKEEGNAGIQVLSDIQRIYFKSKVDRLASKHIADTLGEMEDRPWPEWRNGKPITPTALSKLLGPFGVQANNRRHETGQYRGYDLSDFLVAFDCYITPENNADMGTPPNQSVTVSHNQSNTRKTNDLDAENAPNQTVTDPNSVTLSNANNPLKDKERYTVTLRDGGGGQYSSNHPENGNSDWPETKI